MTRWEVWAPRARKVDLLVMTENGVVRRLPAVSSGDGSWSTPAPPVGTDYAVSLDGGPPRPDPRSRSQPHGVHGFSRWTSVAFPWTDAGFRAQPLSRAVIYELHVGTFTPGGTFDAASERLDELATLGVTHVEVMPVVSFPGMRGWGYDGVDLFSVHVAYGGVEGLRRFVDRAHTKGLAVLLDVVFNHLGPDGNYLADFGPYFTERHHTPWGPAIDFEGPSSAGVRRFFIDNARYWLRDCHLDGLRLDATHAIYDDSPKHILAELAEEVKALSTKLERPLLLITEHEDNEPKLVVPRERGGDGLDAFWYDDLHHAIHAAFTGERQGYYSSYGSLHDLATTLAGHDGREARRARPLGPVDGSRCVACLQNHDQTGNRARGERLSDLVSQGRSRLATALLLTSPFVPLLFQGEEWGASTPFLYFTDHQDETLARAVQEGRRSEHASVVGELPDPQDPATMAHSVLDWAERGFAPHRDVLGWYRALLALRRELPELTDGRREALQVSVDDHAGTIVIKRGRVTLAGNIGHEAMEIDTPRGKLELAFPEPPRKEGPRSVLPPDACALWVAR